MSGLHRHRCRGPLGLTTATACNRMTTALGAGMRRLLVVAGLILSSWEPCYRHGGWHGQLARVYLAVMFYVSGS